jgi:hypothetical protein
VVANGLNDALAERVPEVSRGRNGGNNHVHLGTSVTPVDVECTVTTVHVQLLTLPQVAVSPRAECADPDNVSKRTMCGTQ